MLRDVAEFRLTSMASARVAEMSIPVEVWRCAMRQVARRNGARVRTFLVPSGLTERDDRHGGGMGFAMRVDPPPDPVAVRSRHVRWWRVEELGMSFRPVASRVRCTARREQARIHTFLVPPRGADRDAADRVVYLAWVDAEPIVPAPRTPPPLLPTPRPVTDLVGYAAAGHLLVEARDGRTKR